MKITDIADLDKDIKTCLQSICIDKLTEKQLKSTVEVKVSLQSHNKIA